MSQEDGAAPTSCDISDAFDSSLKLEQMQMEEGYMEGYKDGLASGREEGRQVGLKHGFLIGEELGFYCGCVDIWKSAIRADTGDTPLFSKRVRKWVHQLGRMVEEYPLLEPQDESLQERLDAMRLKFKMITTSMGVRIEYEGYPKAEERNTVEF